MTTNIEDKSYVYPDPAMRRRALVLAVFGGLCVLAVGPLLHIVVRHPAEVHIGLWFHDAIYDTQRHDNEQRSADWARSAARELGAGAESAQRIHDLIMFTRHSAEPIGIDAQVLVDADLSILGAQPAQFQEYEMQIPSEYGWVPDAIFRSQRAKILQEFLDRPHLYCTAHFREHYEAQARRNLQHSLGRLDCGPEG